MHVQQLATLAEMGMVILANGLWQGAAIALFTWLVVRVNPRMNATTRYAAWTLALAAIVIVPILTTVARVEYVRTAVPSSAGVSTTHDVAASVKASRQAPVISHAAEIATPNSVARISIDAPALTVSIAFGFWACAALALLVRLAVALVRLEKLKNDALPLGVEYRERLRTYSVASNRGRDVRICVTDGIEVPVAVGLFDAMVLLPKHLLAALADDDIDQVSLHELAHLLRGDDWSNGLERIVTSLLFFNPAVWFIARQMDIEREVACDDYVLQLTGAVRQYAFCLTKMAEMTAWPHRPLAAPGVFVTRKSISIRIERLLRSGRAISSAISPIAAVACVGVIVGFAALARAVTPTVAFALPVVPTASPAAQTHARRPVVASKPAATARPTRVIAANVMSVATAQATSVATAQATSVSPSIAPPPVASHVTHEHVHIHINLPNTTVALATGEPHVSNSQQRCIACDFSHANLAGRDFSGQQVAGTDFSDSNLSHANFAHANITGTNFTGADLTDASFVGASMNGCEMSGAILTGARFDGAKLTGCDINVASLAPTQVRSIIQNCRGCDFSKAHLDGQDLSGIRVDGLDLSGVSLAHANLAKSEFVGVNFADSDFTGANLNGARFLGCSFDGARLRNVDLTHATFVGTSLRHASMQP